MDGVTVLGLLRPFRHFPMALVISEGVYPLLYFSTGLGIHRVVSRVRYVGLGQDDLGGVFLPAPSALCGSPVFARGRSGLPVFPFGQGRGPSLEGLTFATKLQFLALLADISSKVCQGGR